MSVAALCARLGVSHSILRWEGEKPRTRIAERARAARYDLLAEEARGIGARTVMTAHHLDDQAETVLFRLARGSGVEGLRGMAKRTVRGEIEIARPLLDLPKSALVAYCEARGAAYARDPSNEDGRFARPRLRALAPLLAKEGLDAAGLARFARRMARVEEALAHQAEGAEARLGLLADGACEAAALAAEPEEIARRLLAKAAPAAPFEALERITGALRTAILAGRPYRRNVGGVLIGFDGRKVTIGPEPARRDGG